MHLLLDNDAEIDAQDKNDRNALIAAVQRDGAAVMQLLLNRGASSKYTRGQDVLAVASVFGSSDCMKLLLERGVHVDTEVGPEFVRLHLSDSFLTYALYEALVDWKNDLAESLLQYGADVNARCTVEGRRGVVLQHVMSGYCWTAADFLIDRGAYLALVEFECLSYEGQERYRELLQRARMRVSHPMGNGTRGINR